jgi:hypothetical protein
MNDNYLWDRSGEPDAEVQELEALLGELKYQPRPLQIPSTLRAGTSRRRYFIPLAIAAAIALVLVGAGLWIQFKGSHDEPVRQARDDQSAPATKQTPAPLPQNQLAISTPPPRDNSTQRVRKFNLISRDANRVRPSRRAAPALTEQELAQKDQVLMALRLVSAKLNLAQRKTQLFRKQT